MVSRSHLPPDPLEQRFRKFEYKLGFSHIPLERITPATMRTKKNRRTFPYIYFFVVHPLRIRWVPDSRQLVCINNYLFTSTVVSSSATQPTRRLNPFYVDRDSLFYDPSCLRFDRAAQLLHRFPYANQETGSGQRCSTAFYRRLDLRCVTKCTWNKGSCDIKFNKCVYTRRTAKLKLSLALSKIVIAFGIHFHWNHVDAMWYAFGGTFSLLGITSQ